MSLSDLVRERMDAFPCSGEINFKVANAPAIIAVLEEQFSSECESKDTIDGISLNHSDWRFNLRTSNTEPLLRLNIETRRDVIKLEKLLEEFTSIINSHSLLCK